jgi:hypothetical protein
MFGNFIVEIIGLAFLGLCIAVLGAPQQRRPTTRYARDM